MEAPHPLKTNIIKIEIEKKKEKKKEKESQTKARDECLQLC